VLRLNHISGKNAEVVQRSNCPVQVIAAAVFEVAARESLDDRR